MSGDVHVRFCEGLRVKFPRATRLVILCQTKRQFQRAKRATQNSLASLKLSLSPTKSRMGPIHNGFHFLGIHFKPSLDTHPTLSESTKKTDQPPKLNQPESLLERQEANPSQAVTRIPSGKTQVVATVHPRTCHRAINKCIGLAILEFDVGVVASLIGVGGNKAKSSAKAQCIPIHEHFKRDFNAVNATPIEFAATPLECSPRKESILISLQPHEHRRLSIISPLGKAIDY